MRTVGITLVAAAGLALAGCDKWNQRNTSTTSGSRTTTADNTPYSSSPERATSVNPRGTGGPGDANAPMQAQQFVTNAASGGLFEVESSRLALDKSQSQAVRHVAQRMIDDHTQANDELKTIARRQGFDVPNQMLPKHQQMLDELRGLSGAQFDRRYLDIQAQAHQEAIDLFNRAQGGVTNEQLRDFAQRTLPTLRQHQDHIDTEMRNNNNTNTDTGTRMQPGGMNR